MREKLPIFYLTTVTIQVTAVTRSTTRTDQTTQIMRCL